MGFDDWASFSSRLKQHTDNAHRHFSNLLASQQPETTVNCNRENNQELECLWASRSEDEQARLELVQCWL